MKKYSLFSLIVSVFCLILVACQQEKKSDSADLTAQIAPQKYQDILLYPEAKKIVNFNLSSLAYGTVDNDLFKGRWSLFMLGFTNCPDICPNMLTKATQLYNGLSPQMKKKYQVVFLSVDPKRDTVEHLAQYLTHFNENFVGITGNRANIDKLVKSIGGVYTINQEDEKYYTVDHTARIFIINPLGERLGVISREAMEKSDKSRLIQELQAVAGLQKKPGV